MQQGQSVTEIIRNELRLGIERGKYLEGDPVPSELELASAYKVSRAQSRQALRDLESEGFILRSRGRRSTVAAPSLWPGKALRSTGPGIAAVAVPTYQSIYCRRIVQGFSDAIVQKGYQTISYNLRFDDANEVQFIGHLKRLGVDSLALWLQHENPEIVRLIAELQDARMPLVLIDHSMRGLDTDFVATDNASLGYQLTRALIERGHTQIGFISDRYGLTSSDERRQGFLRALGEAGITPNERLFGAFDLYDPSDAARTLESILARKEKPTAFYCTYDRLALCVAEQLQRLEYKVPEEVELAASDDDELAEGKGVPMITLEQPGVEIGRIAAEVLAGRLQGDVQPCIHRLVPPAAAVKIVNGK